MYYLVILEKTNTMEGYILLEDFQRRNPDLEMKVHSDKLHRTGIGPVSIYYPVGEDGYTKIDEHLVKVLDGVRWISIFPLWSGDGAGQEEVLRVTGPRTAVFTSRLDDDGQGRYIFPDGMDDLRYRGSEWEVTLQEEWYYWLYTTYSYRVDNLVILQDGYLFTVRVKQDEVVLFPRPSRHWFWTGSISAEGDVEYSLNAFEYSEEQFQDLDLENYPETFVSGVLADVTYLREGGNEFRGFVSARNSELACLLVQEYLDSFQPTEWDENQAWDQYQPEEIQDQGQDMTHWEDNLSQEEKTKEAGWKFYHACRRMKNRLRDAYLDWRYGKPVPLPNHNGRKKYRPGQPDKILHPSRR